MADLLRLIMDIREGSQRPHRHQKVFKMNGDTHTRLLNLFGAKTFTDMGILIMVTPTMGKDEVTEIVVGSQTNTQGGDPARAYAVIDGSGARV